MQPQALSREAAVPGDSALLAALARQEDESVFRALVERHVGWVYAAACRLLGDRHTAEDATQAVFILLHQRAQKLAACRGVRLTGWLFTTLQYTVRSMKRSERRRLMHESKAAQERGEGVSSDPEIVLLAGELDSAVARLGEQDRAAILLRFYQGLELAAVGAGLGISEEAARKRVTRAVDKLRSKLGGAVAESVIAATVASASPACVAELAVQISRTALAGGNGVAAPSALAAMKAAKGALYLMAMSKVKVAAGIVIAGAVTLSSGVLVWQQVAGQETRSAQSATAPAPDADSTMLEKFYGLKPDEALRRVNVPPLSDATFEFHAARKRFIQKEQDDPKARIPGAIVVQWRDQRPILWGTNGFYTLRDLIWMRRCLGVAIWEVEGDRNLMNLTIPGDFVIRQAPIETFRAGIERIAREASGKAISLTFRQVERPVMVFKGQWRYTAVPERKNDSDHVPTLECYADELLRPFERREGVGSLKDVASEISDYIEKRVLFECQGAPERLWVQDNAVHAETREQWLRQHNPALVIRHIEEQTGLKATEELRRVDVLFVE